MSQINVEWLGCRLWMCSSVHLIAVSSHWVCLVQFITIVGYSPLLAILYLRQYPSNSGVTRICFSYKLLSCFAGNRMGAVQRASFSEWKAFSTSGGHRKACFNSVSVVTGFVMSSKLEINCLVVGK
jgi:hypothetical protein